MKKMNMKKMSMRKNTRQRMFTMVVAGMVILILFMANATRQQIDERKAQSIYSEEQEQQYREMENQYRIQVQTIMAQAGYPNSGITMTYVVSDDGSRQYTVQIHHKRLENMKMEEQEQLKHKVSDVKLAAGSCSLFLA